MMSTMSDNLIALDQEDRSSPSLTPTLSHSSDLTGLYFGGDTSTVQYLPSVFHSTNNNDIDEFGEFTSAELDEEASNQFRNCDNADDPDFGEFTNADTCDTGSECTDDSSRDGTDHHIRDNSKHYTCSLTVVGEDSPKVTTYEQTLVEPQSTEADERLLGGPEEIDDTTLAGFGDFTGWNGDDVCILERDVAFPVGEMKPEVSKLTKPEAQKLSEPVHSKLAKDDGSQSTISEISQPAQNDVKPSTPLTKNMPGFGSKANANPTSNSNASKEEDGDDECLLNANGKVVFQDESNRVLSDSGFILEVEYAGPAYSDSG